MRCSKCGFELQESSKFCANCGTPLEVTDNEGKVDVDVESQVSTQNLTEETGAVSEPNKLASAETISVSLTEEEPNNFSDASEKSSDNSSVNETYISGTPDGSNESNEMPQFKKAKVKSDMPEKAKSIWKRIPKKWLAIGAGVLVVVFVAIGIFSSMASQPMKLNGSLTIDDVVFDCPSEWTKSTNAKTESSNDSSFGPSDGKASITFESGPLVGNTPKDIAEVWSKKGYAVTNGSYSNLPNSNKTYYVVNATRSEDKAKGYISVVGLDNRYVCCIALVKPDAPANYPSTIEAVIKSVHMADINEQYTVIFKDGDTVLKEETATNTGGGASIQAPDDPTKEGFIFTGWKTEDETIDVDIFKAPSSKLYTVAHITENITLQAEWEKAWTVTFTDGAGSTLKTESVANGKSATAPTTPTRNGYTFKGWNKTFSSVTSDMTIDAEWTKVPTVSEKNALSSAKSYLSHMPFSYTGLIKQLEYEKYSHEDAVYAADNCGANWNEQAVKQAQSYLKHMSFSRQGLIEQLEYEGYTYDQAVYGVNAAGL